MTRKALALRQLGSTAVKRSVAAALCGAACARRATDLAAAGERSRAPRSHRAWRCRWSKEKLAKIERRPTIGYDRGDAALRRTCMGGHGRKDAIRARCQEPAERPDRQRRRARRDEPGANDRRPRHRDNEPSLSAVEKTATVHDLLKARRHLSRGALSVAWRRPRHALQSQARDVLVLIHDVDLVSQGSEARPTGASPKTIAGCYPRARGAAPRRRDPGDRHGAQRDGDDAALRPRGRLDCACGPAATRCSSRARSTSCSRSAARNCFVGAAGRACSTSGVLDRAARCERCHIGLQAGGRARPPDKVRRSRRCARRHCVGLPPAALVPARPIRA